jgi:phospholipid/cholesterol/gamma-HCH transport system ATP-binding protein
MGAATADHAPAVGDTILAVDGLRKSFQGREVLRGVSFEVRRGSAFTVLGPSGAGKSVLLKCLANIEQPDGGRISFEGRTLDFNDRRMRESFRRRCSFLFQGNALFDSLTALQNVALPLEQTTDLSRVEIRHRAMEALEQLELHEYAGHFPAMLSGGMQKRLALARAIVRSPTTMRDSTNDRVLPALTTVGITSSQSPGRAMSTKSIDRDTVSAPA